MLLGLSACASVYKQYDGPQLAEDEIAILEHPNALRSYLSWSRWMTGGGARV